MARDEHTPGDGGGPGRFTPSASDVLAATLGWSDAVDALFVGVMAASSSGFMIVTPERRIVYANIAMSQLTGYSVEELLALPDGGVLTPPGDEPAVQDALEHAFRRKPDPQARNREFVHKDGHRVPVTASAEPLVIDGHVAALVVEFVDRSQSERALASAREQTEQLKAANDELAMYREMVSQASDSILVVQQGQIVVRNHALADVLGFGGVRERLSDILEPHSVPVAADAIRRIESGESESELRTLELRDAQGALHVVEARASRIDFRGAPAVLAVVRDVSERVALAEQLRASDRLDVLTRVSGGAAHELANALASLTATIGEDATPETRHEFESARRLAASLALIGGQGVGRPEAIAVDPLVRSVVAGLPAGWSARVRVWPTVAIQVQGRPDDLALAMEALIVNALESGPGTVDVTYRFVLGLPDEAQTEDDALKGFALIEIHDTGEGMSEQTVARIGEPFHSARPGHVGIGTALAYAVVRARSGRTTVESTPGVGTTVRVYLPLAAAVATAFANATPTQESGGSRLLLVDDNRTLRAVTALALRRAGYEVIEAEAIEEARGILADSPPFDLLVLDIRLADGTGVDLFRAAGGSDASPPTLFVSGYSGEDLSDLEPSPRWQFLAKPFSRQGLLTAIDDLLAGARVPPDSGEVVNPQRLEGGDRGV